MTRIHVAIDRMSVWEASLFIVSSLLVSHGVRRDSEAWVRIGKSWVIAKGSTIRQLRPDPISAESWLRAVVYKGKAERLGASLVTSDAPPRGVCVGPLGEASLEDVIGSLDGGRLVFWYGRECVEAGAGMPGLDVWLMPALANILVDRVLYGLPP